MNAELRELHKRTHAARIKARRMRSERLSREMCQDTQAEFDRLLSKMRAANK